jgi:beta-catenin-like protein 1
MARMGALRCLNISCLGAEGHQVSMRLFDVSGLKTLFPIFMGKGNRLYRKEYKEFSEGRDEGNCFVLKTISTYG